MPNAELPKWATDTPPDHNYQLTMFENNDYGIEEVTVTREEYIALKHHLAKMRGYDVKEMEKESIKPSSPPAASKHRAKAKRNAA